LKKKGPKNSRQNDPLPRILSGQRTLNAVKFQSVGALQETTIIKQFSAIYRTIESKRFDHTFQASHFGLDPKSL
jgi:hypothetical protein